MSDEKSKDEDCRPTKKEILGYIYEYGLYVLLGIAVGLVANIIIKMMI